MSYHGKYSPSYVTNTQHESINLRSNASGSEMLPSLALKLYNSSTESVDAGPLTKPNGQVPSGGASSTTLFKSVVVSTATAPVEWLYGHLAGAGAGEGGAVAR
jgi:hypothetical protein